MDDSLNISYSAETADLNAETTTRSYNFKYYPDDSEASVWMYAMISVGSAFVLFVIVTLYLMCHSAIRQVAEQDMISRTTISRGTGFRSYQGSF